MLPLLSVANAAMGLMPCSEVSTVVPVQVLPVQAKYTPGLALCAQALPQSYFKLLTPRMPLAMP